MRSHGMQANESDHGYSEIDLNLKYDPILNPRSVDLPSLISGSMNDVYTGTCETGVNNLNGHHNISFREKSIPPSTTSCNNSGMESTKRHSPYMDYDWNALPNPPSYVEQIRYVKLPSKGKKASATNPVGTVDTKLHYA